MLIGGVDEAGRGPIIGPMVMAIYIMNHEDIDKLRLLGVKDSKLLSKAKREEIFDDLMDIASDCRYKIITSTEIDYSLLKTRFNLNLLEAKTTASLINKDIIEKIYVDCPSINRAAYETELRDMLFNKKQRLFVEHKADLNYPVVAAASIIAKVIRDREIEKIKEKYGVDFGSGYLSDPLTKNFLETHFRNYPFFRKSWKPWKLLDKKRMQSSLAGFIKND
ncbi:MAG: ribonuclease HII [Candidatus Woesearchaeota archaeon]